MLNFSPEQDKGIFSLLPLFINLPPMLLSFSRRNIWFFRSIIFDSLSPDSTDFLDFIFLCVIWQTHVFNISAYFLPISPQFNFQWNIWSNCWSRIRHLAKTWTMICLCLISVKSRTKKRTKEKHSTLEFGIKHKVHNSIIDGFHQKGPPPTLEIWCSIIS